jgi:hypothetical protein
MLIVIWMSVFMISVSVPLKRMLFQLHYTFIASWQVVLVRQAVTSSPIVIWHLDIWPIVIASFGPTSFFWLKMHL